MSSNYYNLLGIPPNSSQEVIKKAYRKKAKVLHPDRNKSPNAHEDFLKVSEAYEYLSNPWKPVQPTTTPRPSQAQRQTAAQERAARSARMKYKEFINSDAYKLDQTGLVIWNHVRFVFSIFFLIGVPILSFSIADNFWYALIACVIIQVVFFEVWIHLFTEKQNLNLEQFKKSLKILSSYTPVWIVLLCLINTYLIFNVTLHSIVPVKSLFYVLFFMYCLFSVVIYFIKKQKKINFGLFILIPLTVFNIFFLANYTFSSSPKIESYRYYNDIQYVTSRYSGGRHQASTYIFLENNKYDNNQWIRVFPDIDRMIGNVVSYHFETGLFGIKVMKDYKFEIRKVPNL